MTDLNQERPKVGIGIIVQRNGKILIGERIGNHGSGTYMLPGGHLEFGESFEGAARREVEEETGLSGIETRKIVSISNDIAHGKHYVTIGILADSDAGEPYNAEPEKSQNWKWYEPKDISENLFLSSEKVIKNWLNGTLYSD